VPIIMIHGFGGQRGDFHGLATYLQSLGHASLVPDLRGHGQSTLQTLPNGSAVTLDADRMRAPALEEMIHDIRECKKWLIEKNDKEELNLNQLCVIGAEFGGIIAVRWAAWDWSRPVLTTGAIGQDVKAIVLLSPTPSFKGVTMREALQFPPLQTQLSYLLVAGAKDSKATAEAKRLQKELQVHRPKISEDDEESQKYRDLFLFQPDVALSGTKLLAGGTGVPQQIARFIDLRLVKRKSEFAWKSRSTK
jgi:pimeloyl-ACP methyl ester carboxylesterase